MRVSLAIEHERLVRMIKESISLMCKSSLSYDLELNVEGLLGITLDKKDIFLVNINESFQAEYAQKSPSPKRLQQASASVNDVIEIKGEERRPSCGRKKRARRRSRENIDSPYADDVAANFNLPDFPGSSGTGTPSGNRLTGQNCGRAPPSRTMSPVKGRVPAPLDIGSSHSISSDSPQLQTPVDHEPGDSVVKEELREEISSIVIKEEVSHDDYRDAQDLDFSVQDQDLPLQYSTSLSFEQSAATDFETATDFESVDILEDHVAQPGLGISLDGILDSQSRPRRKRFSSPRAARNPFMGENSASGGTAGHLTCPFCGKRFVSHCGMYQHMRLHTGRAFNCGSCSKTFTTNAVLQRHISAIHEKTTHACNLCDKTFTQQGNLLRHQRQTHATDLNLSQSSSKT